MGKSNTSMRLKQLMDERNLRQVDILNLTKPYCEQYNVKMNKSDISQYVSGKNEPSQDKLVILGMALGVSEAWLMGYDVAENVKEDLNLLNHESELQIVIDLSEHLKHDCTNIVNTMGTLNADGLKEAEKRILELQYIPKYRKETNDDFSSITNNQFHRH